MSAEPLNILVVEDDQAHALAICRAFKTPDGWVRIEVAETLRDFQHMARAQRPDIVLMDLNLPDGRAIDLLHNTREERSYPVLILTALSDEKAAVAAMKAGALDYVVKTPAAFADLPRIVGRALREWNLLEREKKAQAELIRASQLASLGELAAGVAHEINNPINGVINYAQMLVNRLPSDGDERELAARIIQEGERIAQIVGGLLAFARPQQERITPLNIGDVVKCCLPLVEAQLRREDVRLVLSLPSDLPLVPGKKQQLQQVILNLISNARHALNEKYPGADPGKVLEIRAEEIADEVGARVRLTFRDQGTGIPEEVRDKIFNPFFTTKPADRGTGLGLSISYGIIKDHGGTLRVSSQTGLYTVVCVELPIAGGRGGD
ncbi:sensor histidine kinase [Geoalkalibacter sp.]|uniref:sensor histidine kinase n=1 Tax=Geoalkalibacter sp. TaxID=3041440 RepID=UPI00272EC747|nr:hybrid sensor histidine kinase/response regulator [Geoalkalibacter sp.]